MSAKIPRSKDNDYIRDLAEARRRFVREKTRAALEHVGNYSFDPAVLPGNVEIFMGAEICAAVVLAGDTSLSSAVLAGDWVSRHDELGRNRP